MDGTAPKIAAFSYIYNGERFDIPFIESAKSIIDYVDEYVLAVCASDDNTLQMAEALYAEYPKKVKLFFTEWVQHFTEISTLANRTMTFISPDIEFIVQLQSDEVFHERDAALLAALPERMLLSGKTAASWKYHHFLGGPDITFPFCYSTAVRVVQRYQGWSIMGDGVQFGNRGQVPEHLVLQSDIEIFHYGKMKSPEKGFQKEVSFQNLFTDLGFPDPKMAQMKSTLGKDYCDYIYLFRDHIINKTISRFTGTHPSAMQEYLKMFRDSGYEQLMSAMEKLEIVKEPLP